MKVTDETLYERYDSLNTEALADLYDSGGLTDSGVNVLKEVITSRRLDWAQFTKPSPTEPVSESRADWSLWRPPSGQVVTDETGDESQHDAIGIEDKEEFRAFIGPKQTDLYLDVWTPMLTGKRRGASFNWAAFFLAGFWLPYRKMYLDTVILYGIGFLVLVLVDVHLISFRGAGEPPILVSLSFPLTLLIAAICGAYGNRWYLSHAKKMIAVAREQELQRDVFLETLSNRGGTSLLSGIGAPILLGIIMGIVYFVLVEPVL